MTCSGASYPTGIKYEGKNAGWTLTVEPSASTTITPVIPGALPGVTDYSGGVHLEGGGTLKVVLDGDVRVVNGAVRTPLVDHTDSSGNTYKVIALSNANAYRTSGVYVAHEESGAGEIGIEIKEEARIGTAEKPVGHYGAFAHFKQGTGDIAIMNRGRVYGHFGGIHADHAGSGDIVIETAEGSVTWMGIRAKSADGDVTIRHDGRIEFRHPLRYKVGAGLDNARDYNYSAIEVNHTDATAGTHESPSSRVRVVSSGDVRIDASDWERLNYYFRSWHVRGIHVDSRGDGDSVVPITVEVTGGVIETNGRTESHGVKVHSEHRGGLVKVDFAGTVAGTGPDGDGLHIYRYLGVSGLHASIRESDLEVTLKPGARIGVEGEGDESPVGRHGARLEQRAEGGNIEATVEAGARIGAEGTPVGGDGVRGQITHDDHLGDIRITNRGFIHAKSSGINVWHQGHGDLEVKHLGGTIKAGDAVREFGTSDLKSDLSELSSRTAGILVVHGGAIAITESDGDYKTAGIGKIEITSAADIESKGEGIFAYAKDPDGKATYTTIVPITVGVTGGKITAKGAGVHAEIATDYTSLEPAQTAAGETEAGAIAVTVDESATVMAEKDGVRVKGGGTQTVTIHGKVMGGGGDSAGVRMMGGGTLTIGARAEIGAASGTAVRSSDGKLSITMKKDEQGRIGDVMGKILNSGETLFEGVAVGETVIALGGVEPRGVYDGGTLRRVVLKAIEGGHEFEGESAGEYRKYHARARVYEALPSVLLDLNRQTSAHARLSAARDGNGGWARVWFGDGEREADRSTTEGGEMSRALAWDFEHWGAEMGFDIPTSTEGLLLGVSARYRDGRADVERGGRIDVSGFGLGVSANYRMEDGWYWDAQFSYTHFDDIDLSSDERGGLESGLHADGYAVGLEVGRRMEMAEREMVLTPRGGLVWSSVDVDGFEDVKVEGYAGDRRVSLGSEDSFQGRVGVLAESMDGRMYASLDVEHEFSEDRDVTASGARLDSEAEATWARLGLGFRAELDETGETVLSGEGFYALADGDNRDYGAGVTLRARF